MDKMIINELINNYLKYDKLNGGFVWAKNLGAKIKKGSIAGSVVKGKKKNYGSITFRGNRIYVHKLVWFYFNGDINQKVTHCDGNGLNNKIDNLKKKEVMSLDEKRVKDSIRARKYYKRNKKKCVDDNKKWMKLQRETNSEYYIKRKIRQRLKMFLKSKGIKKVNKSSELLGAEVKDVIIYLKEKGYDPNNHDIDHIIPLSLLNTQNKDHMKVMFHYSNLQPLKPDINRSVKRNNLSSGWEDSLKTTCNILGINSLSLEQYLINRTRLRKHETGVLKCTP